MKVILLALSLITPIVSKSDVLLKDIGIIGLASHDMFSWDRKNEVNTENGRLDLSTIFDYEGGSRWEKGGDPKNAENSPVWTVTKNLVKYYKKELQVTNSSTIARVNTVKHFHGQIKESYERLSLLEFPTKGLNEMVNNIEQAALRAMHDILPGRVNTYRNVLFPFKSFSLTNFLLAKFYLNKKELNQKVKYFDGDYDDEYKNIKIPFTDVVIDLKEVDRKFIEKFSPYNHKEMLEELKRVGSGEILISDVSFINHISTLFRKGICSKDNKWILNTVPCED